MDDAEGQAVDSATAFLSQHPRLALQTLAADCEVTAPSRVSARLGHYVMDFDDLKSLGGADAAPSPIAQSLGALGSCVALAVTRWSQRLAIPVDSLWVEVRGDLDVRGSLALDPTRPGFTDVRLCVHISGPASTRQYEELQRVVNLHSPVLDLFVNRVPVRTTLRVDA